MERERRVGVRAGPRGWRSVGTHKFVCLESLSLALSTQSFDPLLFVVDLRWR